MRCYLLLVFLFIGFTACKNNKKAGEPAFVAPTVKLKVPAFSKDSAYEYVRKQVSFGARVPGTPAHVSCGDWLVSQSKYFGAQVIEQKFVGQTYTGITFDARNIIASYNPGHKTRILLAAHWDTRFAADHDPDTAKHKQPVMGADDGASGVGVLLEIARQIQSNPIPSIGIDFIFFDAEDQGGEGGESEDWCIGAQYWAKNKHTPGYQAKYGILLDMVGGKSPRYTREGTSVSYAEGILDKVWALAQRMGNGNNFVNENSPAIVDDHFFINRLTGIPMIDIINRPGNNQFVTYHHTANDLLSQIDSESLRLTGQVVLAVVYREANGDF